MRLMSVHLLGVFVLQSLARGQDPATAHSRSAYAGEERRNIKALSAEDAQAYENGEGMGYARAAELNHYPGPKHVLDAAAELGLTPGQKQQTEKIYRDMHKKAVRAGRKIVRDESRLDDLFSSGRIDPKQLDSLTATIAISEGSLRAIHLGAHLAEREVLTPGQIQKYDALRGYQGMGAHQHHSQMHQH